MIDRNELAQTIFEKYPCRFRKAEKKSFIEYVSARLHDMGYADEDIQVVESRGMARSRNIVIGDMEKAGRFITAHYDTPGRSGFLIFASRFVGQVGANIITVLLALPFLFALFWLTQELRFLLCELFPSFDTVFTDVLFAVLPLVIYILPFALSFVLENPASRNDNTSGVLGALYCADLLIDKVKSGEVCVVLFDNEEWGLIGSTQLASALSRRGVRMKDRTVINLDCIGLGDRLIAATTGRQRAGTRAFLDAFDEGREKKERIIRKHSIVVYMSDHAAFRDSFMLCAARRSLLGPFYLPNIHTAHDTECDLELVGSIADRVAGVIRRQA